MIRRRVFHLDHFRIVGGRSFYVARLALIDASVKKGVRAVIRRRVFHLDHFRIVGVLSFYVARLALIEASVKKGVRAVIRRRVFISITFV